MTPRDRYLLGPMVSVLLGLLALVLVAALVSCQSPVAPACTWQAVAGIVRDNAGHDTQDTIPVWACWPVRP